MGDYTDGYGGKESRTYYIHKCPVTGKTEHLRPGTMCTDCGAIMGVE